MIHSHADESTAIKLFTGPLVTRQEALQSSRYSANP